MPLDDAIDFVLKVRRIILERSYHAHVGHIGSALSVVEIISTLYARILRADEVNDPDRDRFVLSKGHAALALYAVLFLKEKITQEKLFSFASSETNLGVHPEYSVNGVDFSTGSLGQGITYGVGAALAARMQKSARRTFVLVSDAECNEGSVWEAAMFAAHNHLSNLIVIVDLNEQQAFGYTNQVLSMSPMSSRWSAFGWIVHEVNGHDPVEIENTINNLNVTIGQPNVIIAHTIFGKGVSFMEKEIKWHYLPMTSEEFQSAKGEIDKLT